jgi:hypothetical protein
MKNPKTVLKIIFSFVSLGLLVLVLLSGNSHDPEISLLSLELNLKQKLSYKLGFSRPSLVLTEKLTSLEHLTLKQSARTKFYFLQNNFCSVFSETPNNQNKNLNNDGINIIAQANAAPLENTDISLNPNERFFLNKMYIHEDIKDLFNRSYTEVYMQLTDAKYKLLSVQCHFPTETLNSDSSFSELLAKGLDNNFKLNFKFNSSVLF